MTSSLLDKYRGATMCPGIFMTTDPLENILEFITEGKVECLMVNKLEYEPVPTHRIVHKFNHTSFIIEILIIHERTGWILIRQFFYDDVVPDQCRESVECMGEIKDAIIDQIDKMTHKALSTSSDEIIAYIETQYSFQKL